MIPNHFVEPHYQSYAYTYVDMLAWNLIYEPEFQACLIVSVRDI